MLQIIAENNTEALKELLKEIGECNLFDSLIEACKLNRVECVKIMLEHKIQYPMWANDAELTVMASEYGNMDIISMFVDKGIYVYNTINYKKNTNISANYKEYMKNGVCDDKIVNNYCQKRQALINHYKRVSNMEVEYGFNEYYDHAIILFYLGKRNNELFDVLNSMISPLLFV